jgi:hypothetical protein|tara:strand:- start:326 stop:556 length:231 start_codon:yes stop_codon:yes gene_type:complete
MKNIFVRELFWLVLGSVLSLFLSFIFLGLLSLTSAEETLNSIEKIFTVQLYIIGCFVSLVSIYIFRIIVKAVKNYL